MRGIGVLKGVNERKMMKNSLRNQIELLQTVADNAACMILMMDAQGRGTYANREVTRLTGYTADELIGQVLHDRLHYKYPDGRLYPRRDCPLDRALSLGQLVREVEDVFVRKDGTFFPVVCSAMPIVRNGKPAGTVLEIRDITDRKRIDQALRLSEERFRSLSKCLPVGIFQNDIEGRCTYTNPRAAAICGFTFEESLGDGWASFIHPEDRKRLYQSWLAAVAERREWVDENRWLHRDGTVRWTICRAAPHLNDAGRSSGTLARSKTSPSAGKPKTFSDKWTSGRTSFSPRLRTSCETRLLP